MTGTPKTLEEAIGNGVDDTQYYIRDHIYEGVALHVRDFLAQPMQAAMIMAGKDELALKILDYLCERYGLQNNKIKERISSENLGLWVEKYKEVIIECLKNVRYRYPDDCENVKEALATFHEGKI